MKIVGITGGSGSGKSTIAVMLCKKYPEKFALLQVDDYFKPVEEIPLREGLKNFECPEAIRFDDMYRDILLLKSGSSITIKTKSELYNPHFDREKKNKIEYTILPKQILIVEGFLALSDQKLFELYDHTFYFDMPIEQSLARRSSNKFTPDATYISRVLLPMHEKYIVPMKTRATTVISCEGKTIEEVYTQVENVITTL